MLEAAYIIVAIALVVFLVYLIIIANIWERFLLFGMVVLPYTVV